MITHRDQHHAGGEANVIMNLGQAWVGVCYYTWLWHFGTGVHYDSLSSSTYGHHYVVLARV